MHQGSRKLGVFTMEAHGPTSSAPHPAAYSGATASLPAHDPKASPARRRSSPVPNPVTHWKSLRARREVNCPISPVGLSGSPRHRVRGWQRGVETEDTALPEEDSMCCDRATNRALRVWGLDMRSLRSVQRTPPAWPLQHPFLPTRGRERGCSTHCWP